MLAAVQIASYQEYQRVEAVGRLIGGPQADERILSLAYSESVSSDPCLKSEWPISEESAHQDRWITIVLREILEEFAIRPLGYSQDLNGGFTQRVLVHGRRENFILGLEMVEESEGTYRLNGIRGLCELLRDVNGFKAHAEGRECTCD